MLSRRLHVLISLYLGPLIGEIAVAVMFIRQFSTIYVIVCNTEIMLYKLLMLFCWKKICNIDEAFLSHLLLIFNTGFTFGIQISRLILGTYKNVDMDFLTNNRLINNRLVKKIVCKRTHVNTSSKVMLYVSQF